MIERDGLLLRPIRPDDYERLYAWDTDLAVWGQTNVRAAFPMTYEAFSASMDERLRDTEKVLRWAIEANGTLIGRGQLFDFDMLSRTAQVGITLGPEFRGQGYGRTAVRILVDFAFTYRNLRRVWLETLATNVAGIRAYEAAGFVVEGRLVEHAWVDGAYVDVVWMGRLRGDGG